jgi:hypothetical protein
MLYCHRLQIHRVARARNVRVCVGQSRIYRMAYIIA